MSQKLINNINKKTAIIITINTIIIVIWILMNAGDRKQLSSVKQ